MAGVEVRRQARGDEPEQRRELESVTRKPSDEDHPLLPGQAVDDEVLVRCVGVEADLLEENVGGQARQAVCEVLAQDLPVALARVSDRAVWVDGVAGDVERDLRTGMIGIFRKAVEELLHVDPYRAALRREAI